MKNLTFGRIMKQHLAFFLITNLILVVTSYGQQKDNAVQAIDRYYKGVNEDTSVKFTLIPKEQLKFFSFHTDAVTIYYRQDKIVKVKEWVLHPPMKQFEYYFKDGDLMLFSFSQEGYCVNKNYFYELIKVKLENCGKYRNKNDKELAKSRAIRAKEFLHFSVE
jgi:bisphosphoglycerate-independent phosphoglycerate mutase (AlkP superfamily)